MQDASGDVSTEQAIQQVLQAEQAANASVAQYRQEAAAILATAHQQAQRIDERARNRIARLDQQCNLTIATAAEHFAAQTRGELAKSGQEISARHVAAAVATLTSTLCQ